MELTNLAESFGILGQFCLRHRTVTVLGQKSPPPQKFDPTAQFTPPRNHAFIALLMP